MSNILTRDCVRDADFNHWLDQATLKNPERVDLEIFLTNQKPGLADNQLKIDSSNLDQLTDLGRMETCLMFTKNFT